MSTGERLNRAPLGERLRRRLRQTPSAKTADMWASLIFYTTLAASLGGGWEISRLLGDPYGFTGFVIGAVGGGPLGAILANIEVSHFEKKRSKSI